MGGCATQHRRMCRLCVDGRRGSGEAERCRVLGGGAAGLSLIAHQLPLTVLHIESQVIMHNYAYGAIVVFIYVRRS